MNNISGEASCACDLITPGSKVIILVSPRGPLYDFVFSALCLLNVSSVPGWFVCPCAGVDHVGEHHQAPGHGEGLQLAGGQHHR